MYNFVITPLVLISSAVRLSLFVRMGDVKVVWLWLDAADCAWCSDDIVEA